MAARPSCCRWVLASPAIAQCQPPLLDLCRYVFERHTEWGQKKGREGGRKGRRKGEREEEKERESKRERFGTLSKSLPGAGLSKAKDRSLELQVCLLFGWQGPDNLIHLPLLS